MYVDRREGYLLAYLGVLAYGSEEERLVANDLNRAFVRRMWAWGWRVWILGIMVPCVYMYVYM